MTSSSFGTLRPGSRNAKGHTKTHVLPSPATKTRVVAPLLLGFFTITAMTAVVRALDLEYRDKKLATALEKELKRIGVRDDLCSVQIEPDDNAHDAWLQWRTSFLNAMAFNPMAQVMETMNEPSDESEDDSPKCKLCERRRPEMKRCSRCKSVWYCNRYRQTADWKYHKQVCRPCPEPEARNTLGPVDYYHSVAHTIPKAQELAREVNLTLPTHLSPRGPIL